METGNIFVTGPPRSGKSTLVEEVIDELGLHAEGLRTPEIRREGRRVGFKLVDVKTGREGILAHVDRSEGPRVSRYTVDMENLRRFTELSLQPSEECDIILIDEIGKMELYSREFEESVENILGSDKAVLAVLHRNYLDRYREHGEIFRLDENYDDIKEKVKSRMAMQID